MVVGAAGLCAGAFVVSAAGLVFSLGTKALSWHPATVRDSVATSNKAANNAIVFFFWFPPFVDSKYLKKSIENDPRVVKISVDA